MSLHHFCYALRRCEREREELAKVPARARAPLSALTPGGRDLRRAARFRTFRVAFFPGVWELGDPDAAEAEHARGIRPNLPGRTAKLRLILISEPRADSPSRASL